MFMSSKLRDIMSVVQWIAKWTDIDLQNLVTLVVLFPMFPKLAWGFQVVNMGVCSASKNKD